MRPRYLRREDVPADVVDNERRIAEATARDEGKPEQALPKIVEGRLNGFFKDNVLLEQTRCPGQQGSVQGGPGRCRCGRHRVRALRGGHRLRGRPAASAPIASPPSPSE